GFDIVRVMLSDQQRSRLQIMAERKDGAPISVDDCAELSRAIAAVLDLDDPIAGASTLEVSSPGIDRPPVRLADLDRFAGSDARAHTACPVAGRRRFRGRRRGTGGYAACVDSGAGVHEIPFGAIARAKLILTDELLAAASRN